MRFVCDHDVDARAAARLRTLDHDTWTAADVLERHLDFMLSVLDRHEDVYVRVSPDSQPKLSLLW